MSNKRVKEINDVFKRLDLDTQQKRDKFTHMSELRCGEVVTPPSTTSDSSDNQRDINGKLE